MTRARPGKPVVDDLSYAVTPVEPVDPDKAAIVAAAVRRHVSDPEGQAEVFAMLGLAAAIDHTPPKGDAK